MSKSFARLTALAPCPEDELLLCCARTDMGDAVTERVQTLLQGPIDWDKLFESALRHRVAPMLYPNLMATGSTSIPSTILEQFRSRFEINAARNLQLASHLIRILNLLTAHDLSPIPFKGPVLAASAYNGLEWRESGDLDILVHRKDIVRARDILMANGYGPKDRDGEPWDASYLGYAYESQLAHPEDGICVDLHWRLTGNAFPFRLHYEQIRHRLQPVTLLGTTIHTLPSDDLLLYLCVHGAKHFWVNLGWICDVAELVRKRPEIVSESLLQRARSLGCERVLSLGLILAQGLLDIPLPRSLAHQMQRDPRVNALVRQMRQSLFDQAHEKLGRSEAFILKSRMRERFQDRTRQGLHGLVRMLRPNKLDRSLATLPAAYSFLYYGLRPIRLIRTYGIKPFKQLRRIPGIFLETLR